MNQPFSFLLLLTIPFVLSNCKKDCPDTQPDQSCKTELTKGLMAYYPFNGSINDQSGNGNNPTAMNGAALTTDFIGRTNSAAGFDGVNDYLIVPASDKLNADTVTISMQVMVNNVNRRHALISRVNFEDASGVIWGIHESQPTDKKFAWAPTPNTDDCSKQYAYDPTFTIYTNTIEPGRWYNIMTVFANGTQKWYVDGVLVSSSTRTFTKLKRCSNANLVIGGWWKNDVVSMDGKIDELRIYNRVLSDCEIAKLAEPFKQ